MKKASVRSSHLPASLRVPLNPRKTPVQTRSTASVQAILEATVQVLLEVGKERLTTTRVALRAGVSVGTLYQYFPNKSSLLQAVLRRHLSDVADGVEEACSELRARPLSGMATGLITAFLDAKMRNAKTSIALYSVSDDLEGAKISRQMAVRSHRAIASMLESARDRLAIDAHLAATMLQGAMMGVSRRMLESGAPEKHLDEVRRDLTVLACAYLEASSVRSVALGGRVPVRRAG
jgi:AcrR family transcriptional regulator